LIEYFIIILLPSRRPFFYISPHSQQEQRCFWPVKYQLSSSLPFADVLPPNFLSSLPLPRVLEFFPQGGGSPYSCYFLSRGRLKFFSFGCLLVFFCVFFSIHFSLAFFFYFFRILVFPFEEKYIPGIFCPQSLVSTKCPFQMPSSNPPVGFSRAMVLFLQEFLCKCPCLQQITPDQNLEPEAFSGTFGFSSYDDSLMGLSFPDITRRVVLHARIEPSKVFPHAPPPSPPAIAGFAPPLSPLHIIRELFFVQRPPSCICFFSNRLFPPTTGPERYPMGFFRE